MSVYMCVSVLVGVGECMYMCVANVFVSYD